MQHIPSIALPQSLIELGNTRWAQLREHDSFSELLTPYQEPITAAFGLSDFIAEQCLQHPSWLVTLLVEKHIFIQTDTFEAQLKECLATVKTEDELHQQLRNVRNFHMLKVAWRDLFNMQVIEDSLQQVSELAKQLINQTNQWLYDSLTPRLGTPMGEFGPQPMLILGMGKLGGGELNFSSDIDLIFAYPARGETQGARKSIEHQQFFTKLAQKLIAALDRITADGQVYRVDMRLRPFGDSGPLVMHFDAMEDYYQEQGRDWERYAMLKALILNPSCQYTHQLSQILRPFIYRRYLDFSAIESLRGMKSMIVQEVRRRGLVNNIKLGQGGIREAEFVVQSLQLINGGRETALQVQGLQRALEELQQLEILPENSGKQLGKSYLWLRKVEHCLQQFSDKQTQLLPSQGIDLARLLCVLGIASQAELESILNYHTDIVHQQFSFLVNDDQTVEQPEDGLVQAAKDLWLIELDPAEVEKLLLSWPVHDDSHESMHAMSENIANQLMAFKQRLSDKRMGQRGLSILNDLMPSVLRIVFTTEQCHYSELLSRILTVLQAILGRTAYLQLLFENQGTLIHLVKLCEASPWVTEQIARFPLLLDELLNPADLYQAGEYSHYYDELRQSMLRVEPDDLELQIETLRQFKLSQQLKIAAADISQVLPVMNVSDHLTYLAEALIGQVVEIAWQQMTSKYGVPVCATHGAKTAEDKGFAVIGYGKLGGWELGYGSDIDLVFVHNCDGQLVTEGGKSIESQRFYLKLAQRILHICTIKTGLGWLYEVDMRLRPSGNAGLLVCHIKGFATYLTENAWTWEHQALCRARFISGSTSLGQHFNDIRLAILAQPRESTSLASEVVKMREKMRQHLAKGDAQRVDLKQDLGGIADIEFIVQFMLLAHTQTFSSLGKWQDNVRILQALENLTLLTATEVKDLTQAYLYYRNESHRLTLQNSKLANVNDLLKQHKGKVAAIWDKHLLNLTSN